MAKKSKKPAAPVAAVPAEEPTPTEQLIAAYATGNSSLILQVRERLGLSAPPTYKDALTRTVRKPKAPRVAQVAR